MLPLYRGAKLVCRIPVTAPAANKMSACNPSRTPDDTLWVLAAVWPFTRGPTGLASCFALSLMTPVTDVAPFTQECEWNDFDAAVFEQNLRFFSVRYCLLLEEASRMLICYLTPIATARFPASLSIAPWPTVSACRHGTDCTGSGSCTCSSWRD